MKTYYTTPSAARVISRTLQRQERARLLRSMIQSALYFVRWIAWGLAVVVLFFGVVGLTKG